MFFFSFKYGQHMGWDICQCIQLLGSWNESGCFIQQTASSISPCALHPTAGLLPVSSILSILLPMYSPSVLWTCPNYLALSPKHLTCTVPLTCSFPVPSKSHPELATCLFLNATRRLWAAQARSRSLSPALCKALLSFSPRLLSRRHTSRFSSTRSNLPAHALPLLWNVDPQRFKSSTLFHLRAVLPHQSTWVWTKPKTLKLKWAIWVTLGLMGQTNVTHQRSAQVVGSPVQGSNGGVEDSGCMLPRAGRSGAFAATGY